MSVRNDCDYADGPRLLYSCGGACDTGRIADRAVQRASRRGLGSPACLSAAAAHISGVRTALLAADAVVVVDACSLNCGRRILEGLGLVNLRCVQMEDMGLEKGRLREDEAEVEAVASAIEDVLR